MAGVLALGTALVSLQSGHGSGRERSSVTFVLHGRVVGRADPARSPATIVRGLPGTATVRSGGVTTVYAIDRARARAGLGRATGGRLELPARPVAVDISAPVIAQRLRDNCETAALEVVLRTQGIHVDQLTLQRELERSGPLDPQPTAAGQEWGDPDAGYVGRADGTGPWGGFGVYPRPVIRLAARHGSRLRDLTGSPALSLYAALFSGRAVLAWIGLGDGPYREWVTPEGRPIRVNLNEHTVVLTGVRRDGSLDVVNVLEGTREVWSRARFEAAWSLLGSRAAAAA